MTPSDKLSRLKAEFEQEKRALHFFDSNCWVGEDPFPAPEVLPPFARAATVEQLLAEMDYYGIEQAIVTHIASKEYDPATGNQMLLDAIQGRDRLFGCLVLTPSATRELGESISDYLESALEHRVKMFRLFPTSHNFTLDKWCVGNLLEELQARGAPLCLWHHETDWNQIASLCFDYPELPIIIEGTGRKILYDNRMFYQLMEQCDNLFLELHNLCNYLVIEDLVKRFGSGRLIFGSYLPFQDPNTSLIMVTHALISEEDKRKIARGNMESLLNQVEL